jgi:formylglycine-generating enzyme required for sulfatase activity/outer membrane protein OmpA-like peptidoglycan-associated protein
MTTSSLSSRALCLAAFCVSPAAGSDGLLAQPAESPQTEASLSLQAELLFWESMKDSRDPAELRAYIETYPLGRFVPLAKARLKSMETGAGDISGGGANVATPPSTGAQGKPRRIVGDGARPPGLKPGEHFRDCDVCPPMVVIPAGQFVTGSQPADREAAPAHEIAIPSDLAVGVYEVRIGEWDACVRSGACGQVPASSADAALPMGNLSWDDAQAYLAWLSQTTGRTYRLPTEAEWEYAARAGAATLFWWGDEPGSARANCSDCGNPNDGEGAMPAGSFAPNPFGLHDVHGNLWEWTQDCWNPSYQGTRPDGGPWSSSDCVSRVLRGGSYALGHEYMTAAKRNRYDHDVRYPAHGFRVVSELPARAAAARLPDGAPFEAAIEQALSTVLGSAPTSAVGATIVLDPVVDGLSGLRSNASRAMEARVIELVRTDHPRFHVERLAESNAGSTRHVLIGTFTGINKQGKAAGERHVYRVCLALIDRESGKVSAKSKVFAQAAGVDITPTRFFRDSPVWIADPATQSYIDSCQKTKPGEPADAHYLDRIETAALINEAIGTYESGDYERARALFRSAAGRPGGEQLRTYNGLYLTSWKVGDLDQAAEAFSKLLHFGLGQGALALTFHFRPGTTQFVLDPDRGAQHQLWLTRVADAAGTRSDCLDIIGYMDRRAADGASGDLGLRRADYVKRRLAAEAPALAPRLTAMAGGADDDLVGSATGDAKDALDRRIEIRVTTCPTRSASHR